MLKDLLDFILCKIGDNIHNIYFVKRLCLNENNKIID